MKKQFTVISFHETSRPGDRPLITQVVDSSAEKAAKTLERRMPSQRVVVVYQGWPEAAFVPEIKLAVLGGRPF